MEVRIDRAFDSKNLNKFSLNLKIGEDFFIADAYKQKSGQHVAIAENKFNNELKDGFQLTAFIQTLKKCPVKISKKYHSTEISIANTHFAIVPKALFNPELSTQYLNLNTKPVGDYTILYKTIESTSSVIVYGVPKELYNWIKEIFPQAKITHELAVFLASVKRDYHDLSNNDIIINIHRNYFDIIHLDKGKVNFINAFPYSEKEDLLYYTLFTFDQLGLDPKIINTYLLGEVKKGSELHQILFQFIKNISFGSRNRNIKVAGSLNELPNHYLYSVFNQNLCE